MAGGVPTVCVPNLQSKQCVKPFPDHADVNGGGPPSQPNATADINGGKMDGFITQAQAGQRGCLDVTDPACTNRAQPDVLGNLTADFGFGQQPRSPQVLPVHPTTTLTGTPAGGRRRAAPSTTSADG
jgi:hypothetical protein